LTKRGNQVLVYSSTTRCRGCWLLGSKWNE